MARIEYDGLEAKTHGTDVDRNSGANGAAETGNMSFRSVRNRMRRAEASAHFIVHTYAKGTFFGRSFSFRAPDSASCSHWIDLLSEHISLAKRNSSKLEWYKKYQARLRLLLLPSPPVPRPPSC